MNLDLRAITTLLLDLDRITITNQDEMETGATFGSFTEFNERLKEYCDKTNSLFVKRTSTKIKDPNLSHLEFENLLNQAIIIMQ